MKDLFVYIGTYTLDSDSKGIYVYQFDQSTGSLTSVGLTSGIDNPSFLTTTSDGHFLYAVSEVAELNGILGGSLISYKLNKQTGELTRLNSQSTQGAYPCHVALDKSEKHIVVSNYMGGNVVVYPINEDGTVGTTTDQAQHYGCSKGNIERQEGPHAHSVTFTPDNNYALAADLGKDMILSYTLNSQGKLMPHKNGLVNTGLGQGPRHMDFHPKGRFVFLLNELGNSINSYRYESENGALELVHSIATLPDDYDGESIASDIHVHPNGKFLYASNRGHDSIIICRINEQNGTLEVLGFQSTLGQHPRNFSIDPRGNYLLVANKDSNSIVTFKIHKDSGLLTSLNKSIEVPQPVCIHFFDAANYNQSINN